MEYPIQRRARLEGYGTAIGFGQSTIDILKQLQSERQQTNLLKMQIEESKLDRQEKMVERMKNLEFQERQLKLTEDINKVRIKEMEKRLGEPERKTVSPGDVEINPITGQEIYKAPYTPQRPTAPTAREQEIQKNKNLLIAGINRGKIAMNLRGEFKELDLTNQSEIAGAMSFLGLTPADVPEVTQLIRAKNIPLGEITETKKKHWWSAAEDVVEKPTGKYEPSPYGVTPLTQTEVEYKNDIADGKEVIRKNPGMRSQVFQRLVDKYPAKNSRIIRQNLGL